MDLIAAFNCLIGGHTEHRAWFFLDVYSEKDAMDTSQSKENSQKILGNFLLWACSLYHVPQGGCRLSIPADIQTLTGHHPQQAGLVGLL